MLTAEWCREQAEMLRTDFEWPKTEASLLIAARVVDEGLATRLKWIILKANDSEDAARQIAKYLREGREDV